MWCILFPAALIAGQGLSVRSAAAVPAQQTIYVSPTGRNGNPGTAQQPIRTLHHARNIVRRMNHSMRGNIVVQLAAGTYRLSRPLVLTAADSGLNGCNIIYRAARGARVVISGGVRISGWHVVNSTQDLWAAPVPRTLQNTRQLYINGQRAFRTRGRLPAAVHTTATGYICNSAVMSTWRNQRDIEFVYTGGNGLWSLPSVGLGAWTQPQCPVQSIVGRVITMAQPCWNNSTRRVKLPRRYHSRRMANLVGPGHVGREPTCAANVFEFLGTPGQWYLDLPSHTIYYTPRKGEDMKTADVEAPVLQALVIGKGTPEAPVHNVIFSGIQFSFATWLFPSTPEGFSEIQANYMVTGPHGYAVQALGALAPHGTYPFGAWTPTPGNVRFVNDRHIQFIGDDFVHLGAAGLQLADGSQFDTVKGCVFTDISANGLELGGVDMPEAPANQTTRDNLIEDNHIYNVATEYHGGVGIDVGYAQNTRIEHNQLNDLPYSAISMGWGGWPDKIKLPGVANNSHDNLVAYNKIFDYMLTLADGGGIYTQGLTGPSLAHGEKIINNVIFDQFGSGHGLYTDNGCCNVTAEDNVIFHINFDDWGGRHRDYYNNHRGRIFDGFRFEHNYWQEGLKNSSKPDVTLRNNYLIESMKQVPAAIIKAAGLQSTFQNILKERFTKDAAPAMPMRVAAWGGNGTAYVAWNPPIFQGSSKLTGYTVLASTGQRAHISNRDYARYGFVKISGLPDTRQVTFTVRASNACGVSPPSLPSFAVKPSNRHIHPPGRVTMLRIRSEDGLASIQYRSPRENGGAPITRYVLRISPGNRELTLVGRAVLVLAGGHTTYSVISGLQSGQKYRFALAAVNAAGHGAFLESKPVRINK